MKLKILNIILFFAAIFILFSFSGAAAEKFELWCWGSPMYIQEWLTDFAKAHPELTKGIISKAIGIPQGEGGIRQRVMVSWAAKAGLPDIIQQNAPSIIQLAPTGVLEDLTDLLAPYKENLSPELLNACSYKGKIYGFTWRPNPCMLFYRVDIFEKTGISAEGMRTWEDYIAAGKKIYGASGGKTYMTYIPLAAPGWLYVPAFLEQQHLDFFDKEGNCIIDTDPGAITALKLIDRFAKEKVGLVMNDWDASWFAAIKEGKLASLISANWMDEFLKQQAPELSGKWRVMQYPAFTPGGSGNASEAGGPTLCVISASKYKDLAKKIIEWQFFNKERVVAWAESMNSRGLTIFLPHYKGVWEESIFHLPDPYYGGQSQKEMELKCLEGAYTMKFTKDYWEALNYINVELAKAVAGKITIDEAIKAAGDTIRKKIGISK